jgi:hypothetical protein
MLLLREQDRRRDESARCSGRGTGARVTSAPSRREQQRRAPRADSGALLSWTKRRSLWASGGRDSFRRQAIAGVLRRGRPSGVPHSHERRRLRGEADGARCGRAAVVTRTTPVLQQSPTKASVTPPSFETFGARPNQPSRQRGPGACLPTGAGAPAMSETRLLGRARGRPARGSGTQTGASTR